MVYVSKNPVHPKVSKKIRENFSSIIFSRGGSGKALLTSLLTSSEEVMLAKRLGVILMLEKEHTYYKISKTLKVSVSTVMHIDDLRLRGEYRPIQKILGRFEKKPIFASIELILAAGMPSIAGPRYQKRLDSLRRS